MIPQLDELCIFTVIAYLADLEEILHLRLVNKSLNKFANSYSDVWDRFLDCLGYIAIDASHMTEIHRTTSKYALFLSIRKEIYSTRLLLQEQYQQPSVENVFLEIFKSLKYPSVVTASLLQFSFLPTDLSAKLSSISLTELHLKAWSTLYDKYVRYLQVCN